MVGLILQLDHKLRLYAGRMFHRRRSILKSAITALIVSLITVLVTLLAVASQLSNSIDDVVKSGADMALDNSDEKQLQFSRTVNSLDRTTRRLHRWLTPVRVGSYAFGWVPWVGDQLEAVVLLGDVADILSDTVVSLDASKTETIDELAYLRSFDNLSLVELVDSIGRLDQVSSDQVEFITQQLSAAGKKISRAESLNLAPPLRSVYSAVRRQVVLADVGVELFGLSVDLVSELDKTRGLIVPHQQSGDDAEINLGMFTALGVQSATINSLLRKIAPKADELLRVSRSSSSLRSAVSFLEDANGAIESGIKITNGALMLVDALTEVIAQLESSTGAFISSPESRWVLLDLNARGDELERAALDVADGIDELGELGELSRLPVRETIDEVLTGLFGDPSQLRILASVVSESLEIVTYLIGAEKSREILVLGQSSDELRAMGGFTSSITVIKTGPDGMFETDLVGSAQFDANAELAGRTPPPAPLAFYMNAGAWYMRDIGWSPDFRINAEIAARVYEQTTGNVPDAVIATNQQTIIEIAKVLGGINTPSGFVALDDIENHFQEETDRFGTEYLGRLLDSLLLDLDASAISSRPLDFAIVWTRVLAEKNLMLWTSDQEIQEIIESSGWSGALKPFDGDSLAIVDSNVGWNKVDRNIERSANYFVDFSDMERPLSLLQLVYRNNSYDGSENCDVHFRPPAPGNQYRLLQNGCYWNYLRVYPSQPVRITQYSRMALPAATSVVVNGTAMSGSSSFESDIDQSGFYFGGLIAVEPGSTERFEFEYLLPTSLLRRDGDRFEYRLRLIAQPGAHGRPISVRIKVPTGYVIDNDEFIQHYESDSYILVFEWSGLRDEIISLKFSR